MTLSDSQIDTLAKKYRSRIIDDVADIYCDNNEDPSECDTLTEAMDDFNKILIQMRKG